MGDMPLPAWRPRPYDFVGRAMAERNRARERQEWLAAFRAGGRERRIRRVFDMIVINAQYGFVSEAKLASVFEDLGMDDEVGEAYERWRKSRRRWA